jgi:hypothetical protein
MTQIDPFVAYDWPTDPAAYRVVTTRWEGTGPVKTMAVVVKNDDRPLATWDWTNADSEGAADAMLRECRETDGFDAASDYMPTDHTIIAYTMDYSGITADEDEVPADECPILIRLADAQLGLSACGEVVPDSAVQAVSDAHDAIAELTTALRGLIWQIEHSEGLGWDDLTPDPSVPGETVHPALAILNQARATLAKWEG